MIQYHIYFEDKSGIKGQVIVTVPVLKGTGEKVRKILEILSAESKDLEKIIKYGKVVVISKKWTDKQHLLTRYKL